MASPNASTDGEPYRTDAVYGFGPFRLRTSDRSLFRGTERVRITPRVWDLLHCLVEDAGRIVSKEKLLDRVWEGTFVEEGNVNRTVSTLRRLLEETAEAPYIETVPRQGYRFVAPVERLPERALLAPMNALQAGDLPLAEEVEGPEATGEREEPRPRRPFPWRRALPVLAAALAAFAALGLALRHVRANAPPRQVAVLPFRFLDGAANGETLGVALADSVIARLGRSGRLTLRPTTAILRFRDGKTEPLEAARILEVDAVLDGRVQQENGRTRVTLQLLRRDGKLLLTESFDTAGANVFELQDRVAERVAAALAVTVAPSGPHRDDAARLAATELYVRGRFLWNQRSMSKSILDEATALFRRAIETDPDFAAAYVGLADVLMIGYAERASEAEEAARRALAIDDRLGSAHASLAFIRMFHRWDWAGAEADLDHALALDPSYASAWQWKANLLALTGRLAEARAAIQRAVALDPTSPAILVDAGNVALWSGRPDEAARWLARAREIAPGFLQAEQLGQALSDLEKPVDGVARARRTLQLLGVDEETPVAARSTTRDEFAIARSFAGAGDLGRALAWSEVGASERRFMMPFLALDPSFRALRGSPRARGLFRALNLPAPRA